ncbi:MAG TPA: phosphatidylserine decarboxylase family protein [Terriglobales bacterium]|jgi:phosphatidylserine decarboxylase|nr:phosphatidylserine decarboxylase family protein [Terriglobales bacterium]
MVRDGIYYGIGLLVVAAVVAYFTTPWLAVVPLLVALFVMWFFRDPNRAIPSEPGALVSPADGKVTDVGVYSVNGVPRMRISIFLNVFDVHVNRSPIAGVIRSAEYRKGKFLNAMAPASAEENEQNTVTVEGEGHSVVFKQIAGLIARRIVFTKKIGEHVERGERVGLIKFGSRTDVIFSPEAQVVVKVGDRVKGGSTVLARFANSATNAQKGGASS